MSKFPHIVPPSKLFPDEDQSAFEGMRQELLADLLPVAPYERLLADELVRLEWDAFRYRNRRDTIISTEFFELAAGVFYTGNVEKITDYTLPLPGGMDKVIAADEARELAKALDSDDAEQKKNAEALLAKHQISSSELLAIAWQRNARALTLIDAYLVETENRRRKLRADYDKLVKTSVLPLDATGS